MIVQLLKPCHKLLSKITNHFRSYNTSGKEHLQVGVLLPLNLPQSTYPNSAFKLVLLLPLLVCPVVCIITKLTRRANYTVLLAPAKFATPYSEAASFAYSQSWKLAPKYQTLSFRNLPLKFISTPTLLTVIPTDSLSKYFPALCPRLYFYTIALFHFKQQWHPHCSDQLKQNL